MATDGDVDYRSFDDSQLGDAAARIDRNACPLNYANLTAEIQRRGDASAAAARAPQSADAPRRYRLEFKGDSKEYFRVAAARGRIRRREQRLVARRGGTRDTGDFGLLARLRAPSRCLRVSLDDPPWHIPGPAGRSPDPAGRRARQ